MPIIYQINIYQGLDNEHDVCMVFLDVSKAFDKVYHEGLLFKLKQFGITGLYLNGSCPTLQTGNRELLSMEKHMNGEKPMQVFHNFPVTRL